MEKSAFRGFVTRCVLSRSAFASWYAAESRPDERALTSIELTELRFAPPTSRCWYALSGTTARSLLDAFSDELRLSSTPTTWSETPL